MQPGISDQQAAATAAIAQSYDRLSSRAASAPEEDDDEDEAVEQDPGGRFSRYKQIVGAGRFKTVYRGFDERRGIDVAWSKIKADENRLSREQVHRVVEEMSTGLALDHPHVIKSYQCWEDPQAECINMITEYLTSGNLREYRRRHKSLDIKALKKWARQILQGLCYIHQKEPPVVHGDLRADKIYINGHSGEIKIGDLGLAVLVPMRFAPGVMPEGDVSNQYTRAVDIFAFGLVMLELVTLKNMDKRTTAAWQEVLEGVADAAARSFIAKCLAPIEERPNASELLKDPFLQVTKASSQSGGSGGGGGGGGGSSSSSIVDGGDHMGDDTGVPKYSNGGGGGGGGGLSHHDGGVGGGGGGGAGGGGGMSVSQRRSTDDQQRAECEAGSVRGEDYLFQFSGKIRDGKLHFRLNMHYEGDDEDGDEDRRSVDETGHTSKTIDFVYDPEVDTPDEIAAEISSEFNLSPTDRDICAAALKEWLADQGPDPQR